MAKYAYARALNGGQSLGKQIQAFAQFGVEKSAIYADEKLNTRAAYGELLQILKKGDLIVIKSLAALSDSYEGMSTEWTRLTSLGADVCVADMPALDTRLGGERGVIVSAVAQMLGFCAEKERAHSALQAKGIKTGNEVIDTLLAEQSLHCNAHGINLTVIADASPLGFISVTDMCSLFGNLMENAVEAVEKVPEKENRLININIRPVAGQVFFCVENSYAEEPVMRGGLPLSTKKSEAGYHGYGIKSVKMIAEKYGGNFTLGAKDGIFRVSILFPLPESEQK